MRFVPTICLCSQVPLLRRRRKQGSMRGSDAQNNFCHDDLPFRTPAREAALEPFCNRGEQDAGESDDHESDEQSIGLKRLSSVGHHEADALARAKHLANDYANQSDGYAL